MILYIILIYLFTFFIYTLPFFVITWKLFNKADKPGWAAIIPFYSYYIFGVISKKPKRLVYMVVFLSIFTSIGPYIASIPTLINFVASIVLIVFALILLAGFTKQYQASLLFWVGYIIFPIIAVFFVNKIKYAGDQDQLYSASPNAQIVGTSSAPAPVVVAVYPQPVNQATPTEPQQPQAAGFTPQVIAPQQAEPTNEPNKTP